MNGSYGIVCSFFFTENEGIESEFWTTPQMEEIYRFVVCWEIMEICFMIQIPHLLVLFEISRRFDFGERGQADVGVGKTQWSK